MVIGVLTSIGQVICSKVHLSMTPSCLIQGHQYRHLDEGFDDMPGKIVSFVILILQSTENVQREQDNSNLKSLIEVCMHNNIFPCYSEVPLL